MRKSLSWIVRVGFTALGLGLIVWMLASNWHGSVVFPAGYLGTGQPEFSLRIVGTEGTGSDQVLRLDPKDTGIDRVGVAEVTGAASAPTRVPGTLATIASARVWPLVLGLGLVGLIYPIQALRWWWLMRCRGLVVGYGRAFRLTVVGQFFSICMPGSTGGDVARAYYAAKGSGRRAEAVVSVGFDRMAGMIGLVLLVALLGLTRLDHPLIRTVTLTAWCVIAGLGVVAGIYASPKIRLTLRRGLPSFRLPGHEKIRRLDAAVVAYQHHKLSVLGCVLISLPVHLMLAGAVALAGQALGITQPLGEMLALIPVMFLAGAVPISPSGIGVMEGTAVLLIDGAVNQVVSMVLIFRLMQILYALIGAALMIATDIHLHPPEDAATDEPVVAA